MDEKLGKKTNCFAVTAGVKPQLLCAKNESRTNILVVNAGSNTIYITHSQAKTSSDGIPVLANQSYVNNTTTAELWVLTSTGTSDTRVQEDGS